MKTKKTIFLITVFLALTILTFYACKRDAVNEPEPFGPSSFAIILNLKASPNVLFAGLNNRQMATITASLKKFDGTPLPNQTVFFETADSLGNRVDIGYFEGNEAVLTRNTDAAGNITAAYYGPLSAEVAGNVIYYIRATVAMEGSQFIIERTPIYIISGHHP